MPHSAPVGGKRQLVGLDRAGLAADLAAVGVPQRQLRMRVDQLWQWIYVHGVTDFDAMTNVSKDLRSALQAGYTLARPQIASEQVSDDGTRKWLLRFPSGGAGRPVDVETVYIPEEGRGTLCLSSQVGCTLSCTFCHTGTQTLVRNLTAGEIVAQILLARDRLADHPATIGELSSRNTARPLPSGERALSLGEASSGEEEQSSDREGLMPSLGEKGEGAGAYPANAAPPRPTRPASLRSEGSHPPSTRLITNVVMMGMGEPLYNFDNVRDALLIAADGEGIGLSKRRITLSTSGVAPMIGRAGQEIGVMLAVSLHAARDDLRDTLVPLNRKYPIAELLDACRAYPGLSNAKRITFEYVMLKGVNDSIAEAKDLVRLLKGIPAKINLIPFNSWPGAPYACSDWEQIEAFADVVNRAGYASPVRTPRGRDILAACGQLKSASERQRKSERAAAGLV